MAILSKAPKPDNFESYNSLNLSFTTSRSLRISLDVKLSLNETLLIFSWYSILDPTLFPLDIIELLDGNVCYIAIYADVLAFTLTMIKHPICGMS